MRDKLLKALVLFAIGVISGLSIWAANLATEEQIELNVANREKGFYKELFDLDEDISITLIEVEIEDGFTEIQILLDDDSIAGYVYRGKEKNNYGEITVLVGIKDDMLSNVLISDTTNTPNFVKKIEKNYLSPFTGQSSDDVSYDAKTGASYTYGSVSNIVGMATEYYNAERSGE